MLDFTIVRDQNAKKTNMELLATTKDAIGKCLNAHLCRHMKYARIGRINKNEQCSVYELTNLYNALSSPLSFADGVGMQGQWLLTGATDNGIPIVGGNPEDYPLTILETTLFFSLGGSDVPHAYTQSDFYTGTVVVGTETFTITYNLDGTLTVTWTSTLNGHTYELFFERVAEEAKDCCVTREDIIAAYCHVINYCGCTPIAHGEFPDLPDLPEACTCEQGVTYWFSFDWDADPLYTGIYFEYVNTVRNHCVFTATVNGDILFVSYNETLLRWELGNDDLGVFGYSTDLISSEWTSFGWGGEVPPVPAYTVCGNNVTTICVSVITKDGAIQYPYTAVFTLGGELVLGYAAFGVGSLIPTDEATDYWTLVVPDINGDLCLAADHKIYEIITAPPVGTYVDSCHRKIVITDGECTTLTACQLLYVQSAQNLGIEDGLHEIELAVTGGTPAYTYQWYSDALMTVLVATTSTISNLSCGDQRWFRVTDSLGCTFEDSRTIICL